MAEADDKKFLFGREWVLSKLWNSLQNETRTGIVILGGPGAGKTTLCTEIISERHKKSVLAHHFCDPTDVSTLSTVDFIIGIIRQLSESPIVPGYEESLDLDENYRHLISQNPDAAFKKFILLPLLQIKRPINNMFLIVDSIDAVRFQASDSNVKAIKSIGELISENYTLLPSWIRILCTARKQGKLSGPLSIFRKISLDDQRKVQVLRDVQQFILSRLDQDYTLRQHINRDTAEMLNQLRIKSSGCFLYLEKVLTGISGSFIVLREIKEIPGTLYGLYLWMCQRLFTKKQFSKARSILSIMLASQKPLKRIDIFLILQSRQILTDEDFSRRMYILRRLLTTLPNGSTTLFHHSFAEWLSDVKYCTQRYLCSSCEGHTMLAAALSSWAPYLDNTDTSELCYHLIHSTKQFINPDHIPIFLLCSGARVTNELTPNPDIDSQVQNLLQSCTLTPSVCSTTENLAITDESANTGKEVDLCLDEGGGEAPSEQIEETETLALEEIPGPWPVSVPVSKERQTLTLHEMCKEGNVEMLRMLISEKSDLNLDTVDRHGRTALSVACNQGHDAVVAELLKYNVRVNHADMNGWTPLRCSAWAGHTGVVNLLLEHGAEVDLTDSNERTPLRAASWGGHDEVVASLLKAHACPNKSDIEGRTPLIAAAYMGHSDIVEKLLNGGAELNHSDSDGRTALSVAALCVAVSPGHLQVVKMLLERSAFVDHQDKEGSTPLLVAAFEGQREVCELLLEFEADVDLADGAGRTPLWAAASMGHLAVVELLLFWGAYVDHIDAEGRTVLSVAAAQGNVGVVSLLLARGLDEGHRDNAGWTPLHYAAFEGHEDVCAALIDAGGRIGDVDNDGKHCLFLASQEGHLSAVEKLINYGADLNLRAHDGRTSLRAAAIEGHKDIVQVLCSRGANLNYRDSEGRSTLYMLALESKLAMAHILIRHGADVETRDFEGRTPLHIGAWQGHFEMVELLVSAGADVNAADKDNRTPLHSASWQGHASIVKLLCERGSEVDHVCNQGATSLCISAQEGYVDCVRVLLEFGGDPRRSDFYGRTPIRVALKSGHSEISRLLNDVITAKTKSAGMAETSVLEGIECFDRPDSNSQLLSVFNELMRQGASTGQPDSQPTFASDEATECSGINSLSFTQQLHQISRQNYRSKDQLPKSCRNGHETRQIRQIGDNVTSIGDKANKPDDLLVNLGQTHLSGQKKNLKNELSASANAFAFTRDSHMKIILGPSSEHRNCTKGSTNGIGIIASNGIRSSLNALKAGVIEATVGKKSMQTTPLVSAAAFVPHPNRTKPSAIMETNCSAKKETQL